MDRIETFQDLNTDDDWASVERYIAARHAVATKAIYRSSVQKFARWCRERGLQALPAAPRTLAMFLAAEGQAGRAPTTIARHVAAIRKAHIDQGQPDPAADPMIAAVKQGIRRAYLRPRIPKVALSAPDLYRLTAAIGEDMAGLRDKAILLLGFAAALRRSEIAGLRVEDILEARGSLVLTLRRSKTDQAGAGQQVTLSGPSVARAWVAVAAWRAAAGLDTGPLFRRLHRGGHVAETALTSHAVGAIIKARAAKAGFDPATLGAHSLRSGRITDEAARDASPWELMRLSRHKSIRSLQDYVRL